MRGIRQATLDLERERTRCPMRASTIISSRLRDHTELLFTEAKDRGDTHQVSDHSRPTSIIVTIRSTSRVRLPIERRCRVPRRRGALALGARAGPAAAGGGRVQASAATPCLRVGACGAFDILIDYMGE